MDTKPARSWTRWLPVLALASLAAAVALTKDDVIRMAREGQSEQAIIDAIHESNATFDLTANDIADLRQAGVSEAIIDAMIESGAVQPDSEAEGSEETQPYGEGEEVPPEDVTGPGYPIAPPIAYPVYPLYYPFYYPVYDPFWPYWGGFLSFSFVHVSGFHTIFPCDHSVIVVRHPVAAHPRHFWQPRSAPIVTSIPRGGRPWTRTVSSDRPGRRDPAPAPHADRPSSHPRSATGGTRTGESVRPRPGRGPSGDPSRSLRLAAPAPGGRPRWQAPPRASASPRAQGFQGSPRNQALPRYQPAPRYQGTPYGRPSPRFADPRVQAPRGYQAPRAFQSPRAFQAPGAFQAPRSFRAPQAFQAPRSAPAPRGGFSHGGMPRGGSAPRGMPRSSGGPHAGGGSHGHPRH
jgi:hypothetical protein